jgi:transcriptional regulator with XRE-family HTH domain
MYQKCQNPSEILKGRKAELGFSNEVIAEKTGLSYATVSRVLNWKPNLLWETIRLVAACLEVPLKWLCPEGREELDDVLKDLHVRPSG